jgi:hypothetical protein
VGDSSIITLTTDFGYKDPFVGIMKGVIFKINPLVRIVDITHEIVPQNIMEASFLIEKSFKSFPHRTIHVVVVDPGVGSQRRPILVSAEYHYFLGPDNGIFSCIYNLSKSFTVIHLTAKHYFLPERSLTFHGRDIFAPVAAWISRGVDINNFGEHIRDYVTIPVSVPKMTSESVIEGEVIYIDHFGNLVTNISAHHVEGLSKHDPHAKLKVIIRDIKAPLKTHYSEAADEMLYSLIDSFGSLELFVNKGNASSIFGINIGEKIRVTLTK